MTKIVYNNCYGGFGLSKAAIQRYNELAGLGLIYKEDELWGYWETADGNYWSDRDADRQDPFLIQAIEELGEAANGTYAKLVIDELPAGTLYRIEEYDGMEEIMTQDEYKWSVA